MKLTIAKPMGNIWAKKNNELSSQITHYNNI